MDREAKKALRKSRAKKAQGWRRSDLADVRDAKRARREENFEIACWCR